MNPPRPRTPSVPEDWWAQPAAVLFVALGSGPAGLSQDESTRRIAARPVRRRLRDGFLRHMLGQLRSPLQLILIFGACVAAVVKEWMDGGVILAIVGASAVIGAWHEFRASRAVEQLRGLVAACASVRRDGRVVSVPHDQIAPGDVLELAAGSLIGADGVLLEACDFFVSQALLTGETFPVQRSPGVCASSAALTERQNCVFAGTSVRSGTATMLVVRAGNDTALGAVARSLELRPPETEFERGLRQFGNLLLRVMIVTVLAVLFANVLLRQPALETLLFAVALAVGLSPELLPAILAIMLSKGAKRMAQAGVIVRRLNTIENLGSMDILCTDKTGTLTRGVVQVDGALDLAGQPDAGVMRDAFLNASLQAGLPNAMDEAIVDAGARAGLTATGACKLGEIPYDFVRKRLSVIVREGSGPSRRLITKGALEPLLAVCTECEDGGRIVSLDLGRRARIAECFERWSAQGYRVLGVASRVLEPESSGGDADGEARLCFRGFLRFLDPPEPGTARILSDLVRKGVRVRMITGDNRFVAAHVAKEVGLDGDRVITGSDLAAMKDEALWHQVTEVEVFAEVDPNQKERIIQSLQKTGHVVGYLGDGINDAPALHAADVGISVAGASDVAREAADLVLLEKGLAVVRDGIDEGRRTFANTIKYLFITTSANFGNMISMALATVFLPFLPLLAKQILLNNFLSDIPAMGIATDRVDADWEATPHRWDLRMVCRFMITFGLISTAFDLLTFAVLFEMSGHVPDLFRTGWFVESLLTELAIVFVVRTAGPFHRSRASMALVGLAAGVAATACVLPFIPGPAEWFSLVPLPMPVFAAIVGITLAYAAASEIAKRIFYRRLALDGGGGMDSRTSECS